MTADRADLIAQVRTLQEKWRKEADTLSRHRNVRDDPYDDRGYEMQIEEKRLRKCADDLDTLLSLLDGPRRQEPSK